jgi:hypothetical protein
MYLGDGSAEAKQAERYFEIVSGAEQYGLVPALEASKNSKRIYRDNTTIRPDDQKIMTDTIIGAIMAEPTNIKRIRGINNWLNALQEYRSDKETGRELEPYWLEAITKARACISAIINCNIIDAWKASQRITHGISTPEDLEIIKNNINTVIQEGPLKATEVKNWIRNWAIIQQRTGNRLEDHWQEALTTINAAINAFNEKLQSISRRNSLAIGTANNQNISLHRSRTIAIASTVTTPREEENKAIASARTAAEAYDATLASIRSRSTSTTSSDSCPTLSSSPFSSNLSPLSTRSTPFELGALRRGGHYRVATVFGTETSDTKKSAVISTGVRLV